MSRVGKEPILIPANTTVDLHLPIAIVKGPKGAQRVNVHTDIHVEQSNGQLVVTRASDDKDHRALHGTTRMLLANAIHGVTEGYSRELEVKGIGYQAKMQGNRLILQLGFSHNIVFEPPEGITITAQKIDITVNGIDKQLVGEVAAKIRSFNKPEPYKGKGIRYKHEYVRSKQGKTVGGGDG